MEVDSAAAPASDASKDIPTTVQEEENDSQDVNEDKDEVAGDEESSQEAAAAGEPAASAQTPVVKKGRGRPPKAGGATPKTPKPKTPGSGAGGRGRPRKDGTPAQPKPKVELPPRDGPKREPQPRKLSGTVDDEDIADDVEEEAIGDEPAKKKGRGRPRGGGAAGGKRGESEKEECSESFTKEPQEVVTVQKRGRGRPRKSGDLLPVKLGKEEPSELDSQEIEEAPVVQKRGRGRPRKSELTPQPGPGEISSESNEASFMDIDSPRGKRQAQTKARSFIQKVTRVNSDSDDSGDSFHVRELEKEKPSESDSLEIEEVPVVQKRGRGRPRKSEEDDEEMQQAKKQKTDDELAGQTSPLPVSLFASQSASQSVSQSAIQPDSQPSSQPASQPASQSPSQPAQKPAIQAGSQSVSQSAIQLANQPDEPEAPHASDDQPGGQTVSAVPGEIDNQLESLVVQKAAQAAQQQGKRLILKTRDGKLIALPPNAKVGTNIAQILSGKLNKPPAAVIPVNQTTIQVAEGQQIATEAKQTVPSVSTVRIAGIEGATVVESPKSVEKRGRGRPPKQAARSVLPLPKMTSTKVVASNMQKLGNACIIDTAPDIAKRRAVLKAEAKFSKQELIENIANAEPQTIPNINSEKTFKDNEFSWNIGPATRLLMPELMLYGLLSYQGALYDVTEIERQEDVMTLKRCAKVLKLFLPNAELASLEDNIKNYVFDMEDLTEPNIGKIGSEVRSDYFKETVKQIVDICAVKFCGFFQSIPANINLGDVSSVLSVAKALCDQANAKRLAKPKLNMNSNLTGMTLADVRALIEIHLSKAMEKWKVKIVGAEERQKLVLNRKVYNTTPSNASELQIIDIVVSLNTSLQTLLYINNQKVDFAEIDLKNYESALKNLHELDALLTLIQGAYLCTGYRTPLEAGEAFSKKQVQFSEKCTVLCVQKPMPAPARMATQCYQCRRMFQQTSKVAKKSSIMLALTREKLIEKWTAEKKTNEHLMKEVDRLKHNIEKFCIPGPVVQQVPQAGGDGVVMETAGGGDATALVHNRQYDEGEMMVEEETHHPQQIMLVQDDLDIGEQHQMMEQQQQQQEQHMIIGDQHMIEQHQQQVLDAGGQQVHYVTQDEISDALILMQNGPYVAQ